MEGTKVLTLTTQTSSIIDEVRSQSYYLGEARKDDEKFVQAGSRAQISADDDSQVLAFVKTATAKIAGILTHILGETTFTSTFADATTIVFNTNTVANYPDSQKINLTQSIQDYIVNYSLFEWYKMISPNDAKTYFESTKISEEDIRRYAGFRDKPVRR